MVADEIDGPHLGGGSLGDLKDNVDAVVVEIDDLGLDLSGIEALAPVDSLDALHVCLNARASINGTRFELDLRGEYVVLDLPVSLKGNLADDRVLDHNHDDGGALPTDAHVLEKARGEQGLEGLVDLGGIVVVAGRKAQIGADGLRLDAAIAFHDDRLDDSALGGCRQVPKTHAETQRKRDATHHEEDREQSSFQRPPHHYWCIPLKPTP